MFLIIVLRYWTFLYTGALQVPFYYYYYYYWSLHRITFYICWITYWWTLSHL